MTVDHQQTSQQSSWPERIDPLSEPPGVVAHHLKKYEFAREIVSGCVLDVACGVGYGTSYLSPSTEGIVGVEIDAGAMAIAGTRYLDDRTNFVRANAERLPFADASAHAVTCFEGIEHFQDPDAHLDEVVRVLRPSGVYVVSTPFPDAHSHGDENPFHLHEFERETFDWMLRRRFQTVRVLGQHRLQTTAHRRLQRLDVLGVRKLRRFRPLAKTASRALGTAPVDEAGLNDFVIDDHIDEADEYVAECRNPKYPGT